MVCMAKNSKSREATSKGERTGHVNPGVRERDVGLSQSKDAGSGSLREKGGFY